MGGQIGRMERSFALAKERYAELGVDVHRALERLSGVAVSLHCWQGDDVGGFEGNGEELGGGMAVTGRYPGKARTPDELRADLDLALSLIPGKHRLNLHASYAETGGRAVGRDALEPAHFRGWIDWARERRMGLDFNPTFFAHPLAADGFTLSHRDAGVRRFWVGHGIACRRIGAAIGRALGTPCVTNVWVPDGSKDTPVDRKGPRLRLAESLDAMFAEPLDPASNRDAVEGKLFGLGSESYVVGSHEFYLGYAVSRDKLLCLDAGHYHPTEVVSDKVSAVLAWLDEILLHVSRGVRWDSDHVVTLGDELAGDRAGGGPGRLPRPRPPRPRLLRRQHQPRGGLGHRHAEHAAGAFDRAAGADHHLAGARGRGRPDGAADAPGGAEDPAVRRRVGLLLLRRGRPRRPHLAR